MLNARRHGAVAVMALLALPLVAGSTPRSASATRSRLAAPERAPECREALRPADPWPVALAEPWKRVRLLYRLGLCQAAHGDPRAALRHFRQGRREAPGLDALWTLGEVRAALAGEDVDAAVGHLQRALADPAPGLRDRVREVLAVRLAPPEEGAGLPRPGAATARYLSAYLEAVAPVPEDYPLAHALYRYHDHLGHAGAAERLARLLWSIPEDAEAARRWAGTLTGSRRPPQALLRRARALRRLHLHEMLIGELRPETLPALDEETGAGLGRLYFSSLRRQRHYARALRELRGKAARTAFALPEPARLARLVGVTLAARRFGAAERAIARLERAAPEHPALPAFYRAMAVRAEETGDLEALGRWSGRLLERFGGHDLAVEAYWLQFWARYRRGDAAGAQRWAERALADLGGTPAAARFRYWLARLHREAGRDGAAREALETLRAEHAGGFYARLAAWDGEPPSIRAGESAGEVERPGRGRSPGLEAVWGHPLTRRVMMLYVVDEPLLAKAALEAAVQEPLPPAAARELADALVYLERYHALQRLAVHRFRGSMGADGAGASPLGRYVYPLAHWRTVRDEAHRRGLDPLFVLAVMREESHFRRDADSVAGAKGLMQLMQPTVDTVARWRREQPGAEVLLEPATNIAYGVHYLEWLGDKFAGHPAHTAAGYNAGPYAVQRWLKRRDGLDLAAFIEEIPYPETRNYVKKVLTAYLTYRELYGAPPPPADGASGGERAQSLDKPSDNT